jgi:hypothetical protein
MGVGIFPVFKSKVPRATFNCDGKSLAREYERLDKLARKAKLKLFSSFRDTREIPDGFAGDPEDLEEILGPCEIWYSAEEGLTTIEGLIALLQNPKNAMKLGNPEAVLEALEELARCLRLATKKGATFRLEMG